jgi:hypothetical protein
MKVILSILDEGYSERIWWRLFWAYFMKVILSVPDEGYSERTWWRLFWAYLMKVILSVPDEGYSEHTWWRLFWAYLMKVILSVPDEGYSERTWWRLFWAYLMKVISRNLSYTLISISTFCKGSHPSDIGDRSRCWLSCLDPKIKEVAIVRIKTIWAFYININVILSTASCRFTGLKYLSVLWFTDLYLAFHFVNRIGGVMVSVFLLQCGRSWVRSSIGSSQRL